MRRTQNLFPMLILSTKNLFCSLMQTMNGQFPALLMVSYSAFGYAAVHMSCFLFFLNKIYMYHNVSACSKDTNEQTLNNDQ